MKSATAFLSYARADSDFGKKLAADLKAAGCPVWIDQLDLVPGTRWDTAVEKALADALVLIVVLTPAAVASDNVQDEVGYAVEEGKRVVPVMHLPCKVPLRLRRFQRVDCVSNYRAGLAELVKLLTTSPPSPAGESTARRPGGPPPQPAVKTAASAPSRTVAAVGPTKVDVNFAVRPTPKPSEIDDSLARWKAQREERVASENMRKGRARLTHPAFYRTTGWWAALGCAAVIAVCGAYIADAVGNWIVSVCSPRSWWTAEQIVAASIRPPVTLLACLVWAVMYSVSGTRSYIDDPEKGARAFFLEGVLNGWTAPSANFEPYAILAWASPLNVAICNTAVQVITLSCDRFVGVSMHGAGLFVVAIITFFEVAWYVSETSTDPR